MLRVPRTVVVRYGKAVAGLLPGQAIPAHNAH